MIRSDYRRNRDDARRGSVAVYALIVLSLMLLVGLLAVNAPWMSTARTAIDGGSDFAALAGAGRMVDDTALFNDAGLMKSLAIHAGEEARKFGLRNTVTGEPLDFRLNPDNDPEGDIVVGISDGSRASFEPVNFSEADESVLREINAIRLRGRRTHERGKPIRMLGGFPNPMRSHDALSQVTAMLASGVVGFRAVFETSPIPLAPIALRSELIGTSLDTWEAQVERRGGADDWLFDRKSHSLQPGQDRLHEMAVRLISSDDEKAEDKEKKQTAERSNAFVLEIGGNSADLLHRQLTVGVMKEDLNELSGEFAIDANSDLVVSGALWGPTGERGAALWEGLKLLQRTGEARAWPLFDEASGKNGRARITGFVAARVARVSSYDASGRFAFDLQPTQLSTATAITALDRGQPAMPHGRPRYVVKLRLVE